jgi:hypothetical protein
MSSFFDGFEKRAASLIGKAEGMLSGLRSYNRGGVIRNMSAMKPGHSIMPRTVTQQIATFAEHHPKYNAHPNLPWKPNL